MGLKRILFIPFGLIILIINAPVFSALCATSGSISRSCDVNSSRTTPLYIFPTSQITINVNANINVSGNTKYGIKWEKTDYYPNNIFTNGATINKQGGDREYAVWNYYQKIYSFSNSGTIKASNLIYSDATALRNDHGIISSIANSGTLGNFDITPTTGIHNYYGNIGTISNSGNIYVINNTYNSEITKIHNTGYLYNNGPITAGGAIYNKASIGSIINEGTIRGKVGQGSTYGIRNEGSISLIENLGKIESSSSSSSFDISNYGSGSIGTLINSQGKLTNDPLSLKDNLPSTYKILINSTSDYGQLAVTSGVGNINFSITTDSVIGVPTANYTSYSNDGAPLNPVDGTPYKIEATGKDITVIANSDWTVTGPVHNILVDQAENFNLTINAGITAKNETGSIAGATYSSVLSGVSATQIVSETTQTVDLDGTDVTFTLAETSTSGTWDLSTNAVSNQSGQVVHIDNTSINDVTITNNGTMWSTENNAIEMDGTEITGTANITNTSTGTIESDSTDKDEAAIKIQDTKGTININNSGIITSKAQGILNSGSTLADLTNSGTLETTGEWSTSLDIGSLYNDEASTITKLTNSGTGTMQGVKSKRSGIVNKGTISSLTNSGTLKGTGTTNSYGLFNIGTITSLSNDIDGIISSANFEGLYNTGIINDLYNIGTISSTNNKGTITNLYNNQGAATSDPLTFSGNLPTNYYVHIDSTSDYGQLAVTSGVGNINFSITTDSVIGVPTANYTSYSNDGAPLNPVDGTPYKIEATGKDITVIANSDWTVTGPVHNILVDQAENFNLTINAGITAKNETGSIAGATYSSVLSGVSATQIVSETTQTVDLDGTDVTFTLAETSTSGTWDLSTNAVSNQSGQVVHIDNTSINDVTITNNGTMWSTENNAIEMDGTEIIGTATITNNSGAEITSGSTAIDEAAIVIKDTTGTVNITNAGSMTGPNGLIVDNSIITFTNTGTVNATQGEALLLKNNAFVNLTNFGTMSGIKGINFNGTTVTASNRGTVTSSGKDNAAVYNTGNITNLINTGTWQGTGASNSYGLYSEGSIARTENSGSIISTNSSGLYNTGTLTNLINATGSGIIESTESHGIQNDGTITWLINSGTIRTSSTTSYGVYNTSPNTIVNFVNEGSIVSNSDGVNNNPGAITNFENEGTISSGDGFFDINNTSGTITNLYNNQGAATSDPLTFSGNLPTNYYVHIDSTSDYGQLAVTSGVGNINFSITTDSVIGVPNATQATYDSTATLNPSDGVAYQIDGNGTDITVVVDTNYTVTGPTHNLLVDEAESFNLTINAGITAKNEAGSIAGATYESVLAGVSASQIASQTTKTVDLDGTDVTFTLAETSTSGTWDLSTSLISDQSGQVVHIDNTIIETVSIINSGTIWSTENTAIEFDGTTISDTATIANTGDATIRSSSTAIDEAAVVIKDTTGTLSIINAGTMTGPNGLLVDNAIVTLTNSGTVNAINEAGINVNNSSSAVTIINDGVISGPNGLRVNEGSVTFTNRGTVTGSLYDVNNTGTLTINNLQGAFRSDPLTLTGELPIYNMLIVNTDDYGQLAVTNGTGTLDFDVTDTNYLDADQTYANVLSGVSDEQIKDLAKTFTRSGETYEWQLEQTSTNVWQLDVASLEEIMEDNAITFPNYINKVNATLNHGITIANFAQQNYQCNVFGENDGCFAVAGRYTDLSDPSGESQAAVFMAGYQVPEQKVRFSVFVDQSIDNSSVSGVKLENHGPMVGFKGVWQQNYDGTGMIFSVANTYQSQDVKITRKVVFEDSEQGQGSTDIETQTYRAELMYGYLYNQDTFMNPYVALQYDIAEQNGYTESASRQTSFPLTFSGVKDETTSIRAGVQLRHRLANQKTFLFGSAGLEHDLSSSSDDQVTASYQGYSFSADLDNDTNETRANALLGVDHFVSPTQKMSISVNYQELAWGGSSSDAITGFASYTIGF